MKKICSPRIGDQWKTKGMVPSTFSFMSHWFQLRLLTSPWITHNSTGDLWVAIPWGGSLHTGLSAFFCVISWATFVSLCSISHELVVSCLMFYRDPPYLHEGALVSSILWKPVDNHGFSDFKIAMTRACLERLYSIRKSQAFSISQEVNSY